MPRLQLPNSTKNGQWSRDILKREIVVDGNRIDIWRTSINQQCFEFRRKGKSLVCKPVEKWFFPQPISSKYKAISLFIPNGKSKHAAKHRYTLQSIVLIEIKKDFGIGT